MFQYRNITYEYEMENQCTDLFDIDGIYIYVYMYIYLNSESELYLKLTIVAV